MYRLALLAVVLFCLASTLVATAVPAVNSTREVTKRKYTTAHSLGEAYTFDPRDGWQSINATDLQSKYRRSTPAPKNGISALLDKFRGLAGIGTANKAIVTWYTGHDLDNPSCWSNTKWHPTDESFVCATTLLGWTTNKPKCFDFVELCNGPSKCTFTRVVDTCAGCKTGTHHLDLTRAAFSHLGNFDQGVLNVQVRPASHPADWFEDLWGPKV
ncbi:DPBB-1 domain-containing protein [Mycena indigotica]|uniref:DPBB-1 domain-containing protein n=1 Tax=Mycena indigotica TaxID=2126181 RepID=A0A8H6SLS3_9AGAR|nr:DPBB-1 domain-containing protein [Mycena indigotica]KAF7301358.1 DPBB-1 domain-containing protein [Mycena indigotica]